MSAEAQPQLLYKAQPLEQGYNLIAGPQNANLSLLELGRLCLAGGGCWEVETGGRELYTDASDPERLDQGLVIEHGDAVVIRRGYHPVVAAPCYRLYYLWALAGSGRRFGSWSDDPAHAWIRELE